MKLEVGMNVRTIEGEIFKIQGLKDELIYVLNTECHFYKSLYGGDYCFRFPNENNHYTITKASHNIIDLIEEKDLLEIEYFSLRYEKRVTRLFEVTYKEERFINLDNAKCQFMLIDNDWTDNDKELKPVIKSIVTKEMFSSISYEVSK